MIGPSNVSIKYENDSFYETNTANFSLGAEDMESQTRTYFLYVIRGCLNPLLCAWTIGSDAVNIIVFYRIGLKDGVNQNFFILSVSDALQGLVGIGENVCYLLDSVDVQCKTVSIYILRGIFQVAFTFPWSVSCVTTAVIAVVRCCCVTMPFTVQKTLTARRQLAAILVFCGACVLVLTYISADIDLHDTSGETSGNKEHRVFTSKTTSNLWDGTRITLISSSFSIIFISMLILINALRKSTRFHQEQVNPGTPTPARESRSVRDLRIIKGIFQVLAIFITCNVCAVAIPIRKLCGIKLWDSGLLSDEYFYLNHFKSFFFHLNTSVNIFVYYVNNSRFRKKTNKLFCRQDL
ncbi:chemosensory receptor B [Elysia marginata]|uniref:Chemosensory receptor B n=1 Tax=Elysia marginata TaxID=1093978 RepID=A0AAV4EES3_9GAST|nr:chemosensory receptor B [Elysia marginata]